jgi:hypothetical protein
MSIKKSPTVVGGSMIQGYRKILAPSASANAERLFKTGGGKSG